MAKRRPASKGKKKQTKKNASSNLSRWWREKSPILRYGLLFFFLLGLFYVFYFSSWYNEHLLPLVIGWQTQVSSFLLNLLGYKTQVSGISTISGSGYSVNLKNGCDGLEAIALFCIALICIPLKWRYKWQGILAGVAILLVLNLIRIVVLFLTGIHWPAAFDFLHLHGGFVIFTLVSLLLVMIWAGWAIQQQKKEAHAT